MMTEVDLFISTKAVKVLNADTQVRIILCSRTRVHMNDFINLSGFVSSLQETMMDSALRTISYIADIGSVVVLMARRRVSQASSEEFSESSDSNSEGKSQYRMICYVFESEDVSVSASHLCSVPDVYSDRSFICDLSHFPG